MKKLLILALLLTFTTVSYSQIGMMARKNQMPFISTWVTTGSPETITLPLLSSGGQYDFVVDWGDGTTERITSNTASHSYAVAGTQTIRIKGLIKGWKFDYSGDKFKIRDISQWGCLKGAGSRAFYGCTNLEVSATDPLNTEGITDFSYQFGSCASLTTLNVISWDVSNGVDFSGQFSICSNLTSLNVTDWDVSNGASFYAQFANCFALTTLDVSNWDVSNGQWFELFMHNCPGMTTTIYNQTLINWKDKLNSPPYSEIDINFGGLQYNLAPHPAADARANIITKGWTITDGGGILPFISTWVTSAPNETITLPLLSSGGQYNFTVDWGDGNTETITINSASHSYATAGAHTITISGLINGWRFNNGGHKAKIRDISQWGCLKGAGSRSFYGCTYLEVSATDPLNTEGITDFSFQFANCNSLTTLDVSGWDVSKGINFSVQFAFCFKLTTLDVSNWDVSKGTNFQTQFYSCHSLTTLDVSGWDVSSGTNFNAQFGQCSSLTTLDVSGWDVSKGTNFSYQFYYCYRLTTLDVSGWDVSKGVNFSGQFADCFALTTLDVSNWDVSKGTNFYSFMDGCPGMTTPVYNQTLIKWSALTLRPDVDIDFGGSKYNSYPNPAYLARGVLTHDPNWWSINDGGGI